MVFYASRLKYPNRFHLMYEPDDSDTEVSRAVLIKTAFCQRLKAEFAKKKRQAYACLFFLAAGEGFEPSHTESESAVLPLHKPAIFDRRSEQILLYEKSEKCQ